ncbi:hypothetical protein TUM20984_31600 [Mycobacterium antarcticum]|nr:hypothetical protein TUM20984_31600 [Mycolicibacterium sp. TUM20984]
MASLRSDLSASATSMVHGCSPLNNPPAEEGAAPTDDSLLGAAAERELPWTTVLLPHPVDPKTSSTLRMMAAWSCTLARMYIEDLPAHTPR